MYKHDSRVGGRVATNVIIDLVKDVFIIANRMVYKSVEVFGNLR